MQLHEIWQTVDLKKGLTVQVPKGLLFTQDNNGTLMAVRVLKDGETVELEGTVAGYFMRADGGTVTMPGFISEFDSSVAAVVVPQSACAVPGALDIVLRLSDASQNSMVLGAWQVYVQRGTTDTVIDPGTIIPSVNDLIAEIERVWNSIPADYSRLDAQVHSLQSDVGTLRSNMTSLQGQFGTLEQSFDVLRSDFVDLADDVADLISVSNHTLVIQ